MRLLDHREERDEEERRRNQIGEEDADAETLADAARQSRERVAGGQGQHERDRDDADADDGRVREPRRILRVVEQEGRVVQGRAVLAEPVGRDRRVVELRLVLERRDHHHVEREGEQDRERADDQIREALLLHETSVLRAKSSIAMLTTASTGNRKSEMAAPGPIEPDSIPVL